jgi:hypothetical protein
MPMKAVKIVSIVAVCVVLAIASAMYIQHRMKLSEINEKLSETIGKDQGLVEIILKIPQADITYGEVFDLCEKSVEERNKLIIELRGLYPNMKSNLKDSLVDFLSIENDLVRNQSLASRKQMEINSESKKIDQLESSDYSYYYASTIRSLREEMRDDYLSYFDSRSSFIAKYNTLLEKEKSLYKMMNDAGMRFMLMYAKYKELNDVSQGSNESQAQSNASK